MATVTQQVTQSDVSGDRSKDVTTWVIRGRFDASDKGTARVIKALASLGLSDLFDITEDIPVKAKSSSDPRATAIREWARENGIEVSDRGRLSISTVEAFEAAGN